MDEQVDLQGLDEGARALVQRLLTQVQEQATDLKHKQAQIDKLAYEMALLKRLKFAAKTEALNTDQRKLLEDDLEEDLQAVHEEVEQLQTEAERAPRQQAKRLPLPAQLPRQEFQHEPEVTECCDQPMRRIGEDVAEKLDYTPGVFTVHRHVRGKWVCACCQSLKQKPVDAHIIDKGIPTSGLLAQVLVAKYSDHLPLYRQEAIYARAGVPIPRSTLAHWVASCGVQLQPLVDALRQEMLAHSVVHADETPVQVLKRGSERDGKTRRAYLWAYTPGRHEELKVVIYDFCESRAGKHAGAFLKDWSGTLLVDDFAGYKQLMGEQITEAGCWAHARRKFFELHTANKSQIAVQALDQIGQLYEIEQRVQSVSDDERLRVRQQQSRPVIGKLHSWLQDNRARVPEGSATAKAIDYSLRRWQALTVFVDNAQVPIDNNWVENQIRPIALGRKNWLFAGSQRAGERAAAVMSLIQSAKIVLPLIEGVIPHQAPDSEFPEVRVQGSIRAKNANGDRLVTLFLVNAQEEPDTNRDTAWVFQPELIVRSEMDAAKRAIFRRRPVLDADGMDPEREALEMIYRNRVEFAVGHGVAVHAETADDVTLATEVRTTVMPQYEVQVTETPGLDPSDRPAMREMVSSGLLDMQRLATLEIDPLVDALSMLTKDYAAWINEQRARVGAEVTGYDTQSQQAMDRCQEIHTRLQQGIDTLKSNENALAAFRFANRAMATQRVRSQYALAMRRGEDVTLDKFDVLKNRSWRPFQLAFLLLSIPSLADPSHPDRVQPVEAYADLLWFPTGGGKTEAYLGVAAFTMAIRRMQGNLGGFDSSRGLAVIMRYTLRLLTLQQFQRATALICAMEVLRREALDKGDKSLGTEPFTIGLWVGNKVTPGTTDESHEAIEAIRNPGRNSAGTTSPAQLTSCPWCGSEIKPGRDVKVDKNLGRTKVFCGDPIKRCDFSKGDGIPVLTVDEEIYHRPPTMMIATVDKFAMMAWRGQVRTLFGRVGQECERHGLLWKGTDCNTGHRASGNLPAARVKSINPIRPPDLIIQDEFHLISGPLGTMVGLYETAVDELCGWTLDGKTVKPKIIASTATVRKAKEQVNNVFMRRVSVFPPHGLDVEDNFFSVQRSIEDKPGRRYLGVCSPGSSRPAMLIRVYTAFLTAAQELFDRFGEPADPYMTMVGYFNSLRELGGMKRLAEDDVQTRSYRVQMSMVERPALAQRSISNIRELTSRVSSQDIPKYLDNLEVKFKSEFDAATGKYVTRWQEGDTRAIDVVLATNMLSVGVDVNRLGLMAVNGQPKGTAEYIQATSRVGRSFPGLVCTVLTWARPRDLSHYETFEHYHATFYKHVEAQSVTPFSPRAMDRGLTGSLLSLMRLENDGFSPNEGAGQLSMSNQAEIINAIKVLATRAGNVAEDNARKQLAETELKERADEWAKEVSKGGRILAYEKRGPDKDKTVALIKSPGLQAWDNWTVPMSMREVEPGVRLIMNTSHITDDHDWKPRPAKKDEDLT